MSEISDGEMLAKLIERARLLIAIDDEMPAAIKLETQPLLKQLEQLLAVEESAQDVPRIRATHELLSVELAEYANVDALLAAMRNFLPE